MVEHYTAARQVHAPAPLARSRRHIGHGVVLGLAAVLILTGLGALAISFLLHYETIRDLLAHQYGTDRTSRYFPPGVFTSVRWRVQFVAGCLMLLGAGIALYRERVARSLDSYWGALVLSARHNRRWGAAWSPVTAAGLALLTLIGFGLRIRFIGQPMRYDESATVLNYASQPLYLALSVYNEPNNHLFHTLMVHIAMQLAGAAEWVVRMPAMLAGTLLCVLAYALGRRLAGQTAGLWAAALVATSSIVIEYSTNARGYTLVCCATVALLINAFDTFRSASVWRFFLFALTAVVGCWTIPVFLLSFGGVVFWMIWESQGRARRFRRLYWSRLALACVIAGALTLLVYVPPLVVSGVNRVFLSSAASSRSLETFVPANLVQFNLTWSAWGRDLPVWMSRLMVVSFIAAAGFIPRMRRLVISLGLWILLLFLARRFVPFARNWLQFLPVFLVGAAAGAALLMERFVKPSRTRLAASAGAALVLAVLLAVPVVRNGSVLSSLETGVLKSAPEIATFLALHGIPPEHVFRNSTSDLPLQYYWWRLTGSRPGNAKLEDLSGQGLQEGWFLLNTTYGEGLPQFSARHGIQNVRVLEKHAFDGADLYRVAWNL